jgi:hypothetical protein
MRHPGDKGSEYEAAFRSVVAGVFPSTWKVGEGEIIDPHGNRSPQTDVVIARPTQPSLLCRDEVRRIAL